MKKILLVAAVALLGFTANAQDGLKGTWWAAGQLSVGSSKDAAETKTSTTVILPIVGTFITKDITVGLGIGNIGTKTTPKVGESTTGNTLVVEPLVRKYWNVKGSLFFFGQAALPIMMGKDEAKTKTSSVALDFAPGFDYVVNKWLTVETSFSVANIGSSTTTPDGGTKSSDFNFTVNPFDMSSAPADARSIGGLRVGVKFLF